MPDEPAQRSRKPADEPVRRARLPPTAAADGRRRSSRVDTGYTAGGVPTFDSVREKIETRYGTAIGAAELDAETPEGRTVEEQYDARQRAAAERLAQIRESMRKPRTSLSSRIATDPNLWPGSVGDRRYGGRNCAVIHG